MAAGVDVDVDVDVMVVEGDEDASAVFNDARARTMLMTRKILAACVASYKTQRRLLWALDAIIALLPALLWLGCTCSQPTQTFAVCFRRGVAHQRDEWTPMDRWTKLLATVDPLCLPVVHADLRPSCAARCRCCALQQHVNADLIIYLGGVDTHPNPNKF